MADPEYKFRLSALRKEETYRLAEGELVRSGGGKTLRLPLSEVESVRVYQAPGLGMFSPAFERCVVRPRRGPTVALSSQHFAGFGRFEDRTGGFRPFVDALVRRIAEANPRAVFRAGMPPALWWSWAVVLVLAAVITPLAVLMIVVGFIEERSVNPALIAVLAILLTLFLGLPGYVRALRRGRSRRFDPRAEPIRQPDLSRG